MVSFTSILALVAAAGVHSAVAAPVAEPAVEMAVGRDALNIMEDRAFTEFQEREVINCKITNPTDKDNWSAGQPAEVTWDKSCVADPKFKDYTGTLVLGYTKKGSESENLNVEHPLADNFKLSDGYVDFYLPSDLPSRKTYFVVLMGDSGNKSQEFAITGADAEGKTGGAASSSSSAHPSGSSSASNKAEHGHEHEHGHGHGHTEEAVAAEDA